MQAATQPTSLLANQTILLTQVVKHMVLGPYPWPTITIVFPYDSCLLSPIINV